MTFVYLNLTKNQYAELGEATLKKKPLILNLTKNQFVEGDESTANTVKIKFTKAQIDKLKKKDLKVTLSALQCKKAVEEIKKVHGGALPLLALAPLIMKGIATLGAAGAAAGGVSQIVNAVNNKKYQDKMVSETKRHNQEMEKKGNGLFLSPQTKGKGLFLAKGQGLYLKPGIT